MGFGEISLVGLGKNMDFSNNNCDLVLNKFFID